MIDENGNEYAQDSDIDLFKTYSIRFENCDDFLTAVSLNNLADDIGYSDMILTYSNESFRDQFAVFLKTRAINISID